MHVAHARLVIGDLPRQDAELQRFSQRDFGILLLSAFLLTIARLTGDMQRSVVFHCGQTRRGPMQMNLVIMSRDSVLQGYKISQI